MKSCSKCNATKPRSEFYAAKSHSDGLHSWCKACFKAGVTEYTRVNHDKRRRWVKNWLDKSPAARAKNQAKAAQYRAANPERVKTTHRIWAQKNADQRVLSASAYRARRRATPVNDLTRAEWQQIKTLYQHRCVYCGKQPTRLTMDHIVPLSAGGSHTKANVVPACLSCNSRKRAGAAPPFQPALLS